MHKQGRAITAEEKEQAIALAQTSLTQEQIAGKVGISRRSVGRIWQDEGIRRDGETAPKGTTKVVTRQDLSLSVALDPVQVARRKEHSDYLREQLRFLAAHVWVPAPDSVYLWPGPTELHYPVNETSPFGTSETTARQSAHFFLKMAGGQISASPGIEGTADWKFLRAHLKAEKAPSVIKQYAEWVTSLGGFFATCYEILSSVVTEANKRVDAAMRETARWEGVRMASRWGERGVGKGFYEDIYSLAVSGYRPDQREFSTVPVEGQSGLSAFWRSGRGLAIGTAAEVDAYTKVHETLRIEAGQWGRTKELLEEIHQQCQQKGQSLLSRFYVMERRGDFKGVCEICRPWRGL